MAETITYVATALTTVKRDSVQLVEAAEMGEVGIGGCVIDDPDGTTAIVGLKAFKVDQDSAPAGNQRVFTGYVADRRYHRGEFMVGAAREIDVSLADVNVLLGDYVVWDTDGNRPAETVATRMAWLLASGYAAFTDQGYVASSSVSMDANDYRTSTAGDVLADCARAAAFNYFLYYDEAAAAVALWFDDPVTSSAYSSTTAISNDGAADGVAILAPIMDAELTRDPSKVASGELVTYAKGNVYRTNATTATNFRHRDVVASTTSVKTAANANTLGDQLLSENASEDDRITLSVWVLPENVNDIRAGHLLSAKFSHFATEGYGDWSSWRVLRRTVSQPQDTDERYQVALELTPASPLVAVYSYAELQNATYYDAAGHPTGGSELVQWENTGDSPGAGWFSNPKVGLVAYDTTGFHAPGVYTGIKVTGGGTVAATTRVNWNFVWSGSGRSVTVEIRKNGTAVGSKTVADTYVGGIHGFVSNADLTVSGITCSANDIFTTYVTWSGTDPAAGSISGAQGAPFSVSGYLT